MYILIIFVYLYIKLYCLSDRMITSNYIKARYKATSRSFFGALCQKRIINSVIVKIKWTIVNKLMNEWLHVLDPNKRRQRSQSSDKFSHGYSQNFFFNTIDTAFFFFEEVCEVWRFISNRKTIIYYDTFSPQREQNFADPILDIHLFFVIQNYTLLR